MSIIECPECEHSVSNKARQCVNCGFPMAPVVVAEREQSGLWNAVLKSKTPINLFSLAMMACASVLGFSATNISTQCSLIAFTYTLHVFLAVTGMFFVTLLFNRSGIYHPADMAKAHREGFETSSKDNPRLAASLIALMLIAYGLYQYTQSAAGPLNCS